MRPRFPWALGLLLIGIVMAAGPASAGDRTLAVDDILRLHAAGLADDIIISEIVVTNTVFTLEVDDILRLQDAGVSEQLLQFMIDTARPQTPSSDQETATPAPSDTAQAESGEEQHAYVDEEPSTHFFVGLNWGYPSWWYGYYWHDYWYYDSAYYPWYVSWSYPCGSYYPSWYYGNCWAPAGWGYQYNYCSSHYPYWDSCAAWNNYYYPYNNYAYTQGLSQSKYKVPGGSSGKLLYADAGLQTRDVSRISAPVKTTVRSSPHNLALDDHGKVVGDMRRGVRQAVGKAAPDMHRGTGLRRPAKSSSGQQLLADRGDVRRVVRPARKSATVDGSVHKVTRPSAGRQDGGVQQAPDAPPVKVLRSAPTSRGSSSGSHGYRSAPSSGGGSRSGPSHSSRGSSGGGRSSSGGGRSSSGGGGRSYSGGKGR